MPSFTDREDKANQAVMEANWVMRQLMDDNPDLAGDITGVWMKFSHVSGLCMAFAIALDIESMSREDYINKLHNLTTNQED